MEGFWVLLILAGLTSAREVQVKDQVFCAMDQLADLVDKQGSILEDLIKINEDYANKSDYFSRKLQAWQREQQLAQQDVTKYITNPLNAYILIKRTSLELQIIEHYLPADLKNKLQKLWLYKEDIIGATEGLFRLQVTYKISSEDFANGIIMGRQVREPFSAHDLFAIGLQALDLLVEWQFPRSEDFFAIQYMQMALDKVLNGGDPDGEVHRQGLVLTLSEVYYKVGNYKKAADTLDFAAVFDENVATLKHNALLMNENFGLSKLYIEDPYNEEIIRTKSFSWRTDEIYTNQACRGDRALSLKEQSKLFCRYDSSKPYAKIGPFKIEVLHNDPLVHLYHEIVFDSEIEAIKKYASVKLNRGKNYIGSKESYTNRRITKTAFVSDFEHNLLAKVGKRVNAMTGLTSLLKKELQVQNYGVAGYIHAHWDNRLENTPDVYADWGNRFATALFYLSDVEIGGYTAFPYAKVRALPIKGTAVFWFSTKLSGETELLMRHASCPVLLGSKWVANRWIYEKGNEFTRGCPKDSFTGSDVQDFYDEFF